MLFNVVSSRVLFMAAFIFCSHIIRVACNFLCCVPCGDHFRVLFIDVEEITEYASWKELHLRHVARSASFATFSIGDRELLTDRVLML